MFRLDTETILDTPELGGAAAVPRADPAPRGIQDEPVAMKRPEDEDAPEVPPPAPGDEHLPPDDEDDEEPPA